MLARCDTNFDSKILFDLNEPRRPERAWADAAARVERTGVSVRSAALDLGSATLVEDLGDVLAGLEIGLLIYNAGIAAQNDFFEADVAGACRMNKPDIRDHAR